MAYIYTRTHTDTHTDTHTHTHDWPKSLRIIWPTLNELFGQHVCMYTFNIVSTLFLEFSLIPGTWYMLSCVGAKLLQSCPILCDPVDRSLSGSSVHGIFQSRI